MSNVFYKDPILRLNKLKDFKLQRECTSKEAIKIAVAQKTFSLPL